MNIHANFVDIPNRKIFPAEVRIAEGKISQIKEIQTDNELPFLMPGFIDAHVHVESSMLVPSEFARLSVVHGTVATISDPHEIANVCGMQGVEYMIENGKQVPFHFFFGAPSCVPATPFETAGGEINAADIENLMARSEILYLAEMMNWPGTVHRDPVVMEKIRIAQKYSKPIDGHAPGLMGELAEKYVSAGPSTDHECFTYEEALGKIKLGMKISIREGSAAKNFEALIELIDDYPEMIMFCSDDKHPDNLWLALALGQAESRSGKTAAALAIARRTDGREQLDIEREGADGRDHIEPVPAHLARIGHHPTRHAQQAGQMHQQKCQDKTGECQPESPAANLLRRHTARHQWQPIIQAGNQREKHTAHQHIVHMRHHKVRVMYLPVKWHQCQHNAGQAATNKNN